MPRIWPQGPRAWGTTRGAARVGSCPQPTVLVKVANNSTCGVFVTALALADSDPAKLAVDAVVIVIHAGDDDGKVALAAGSDSVARAFGGNFTETLRMLGATGAVGEVTKLASFGAVAAPMVVAVGLGPLPASAAGTPDESLRRAAGSAVRALAGNASVALALAAGEDEVKA